jgi:asparagine synthase (glutamine-hydrolysing)
MCGIAGIVRRHGSPLEPQRLKAMCDILEHRGPDDAGYVLFGAERDRLRPLVLTEPQFANLGRHLPSWGDPMVRQRLQTGVFDVQLGHRRLSILDISSAGHQPMATPNERFWIVYNGELYNSPALRDELLAQGVSFVGHSDTEVLLRAWELYGLELLPRLDGMFALAIFDTLQRTLTLARDRFGVKPLYYALSSDRLIFASEIKALFASGLIRPEFHEPALAEYLTFQNLLGNDTIFRDVRLLPAGAYREIPLAGPVSPVQSYYRCYSDPCAPTAATKLGDAIEQTRHLFVSAVRRQLLSDVPVGSYLSGGMDSGAIVSVSARNVNRLRTFTLGMCLQGVEGMEARFDERAQAEILSNQFQTEHYTSILRPVDLPSLIPTVTWHLDDPRLGMCYQNFHIARLASRLVKVCLSGMGGDELFGGYPWRYAHGINSTGIDAFDRAYFHYWHRLVPPGQHSQFFSPVIQQEIPGVGERFFDLLNQCPVPSQHLPLRENLLHRALAFEFHTFLQGLFIVEDHISMAHSLETRVPFLDNALTEHAFTLPSGWKVHRAADGIHTQSTPQSDGKWILRRAMEPLLPQSFIQQPKQGFSTPEANWYRGPLLDYLREIFLDASAEQRFYLKPGTLARLLREHEAGTHNHRLLLWSLLSLEWLNRHYMDQPVAARLAA